MTEHQVLFPYQHVQISYRRQLRLLLSQWLARWFESLTNTERPEENKMETGRIAAFQKESALGHVIWRERVSVKVIVRRVPGPMKVLSGSASGLAKTNLEAL